MLFFGIKNCNIFDFQLTGIFHVASGSRFLQSM
jgi:hypothetical protein